MMATARSEVGVRINHADEELQGATLLGRVRLAHGKDAGPKVCLWHIEVRGRS